MIEEYKENKVEDAVGDLDDLKKDILKTVPKWLKLNDGDPTYEEWKTIFGHGWCFGLHHDKLFTSYSKTAYERVNGESSTQSFVDNLCRYTVNEVGKYKHLYLTTGEGLVSYVLQTAPPEITDDEKLNEYEKQRKKFDMIDRELSMKLGNLEGDDPIIKDPVYGDYPNNDPYNNEYLTPDRERFAKILAWILIKNTDIAPPLELDGSGTGSLILKVFDPSNWDLNRLPCFIIHLWNDDKLKRLLNRTFALVSLEHEAKSKFDNTFENPKEDTMKNMWTYTSLYTLDYMKELWFVTDKEKK